MTRNGHPHTKSRVKNHSNLIQSRPVNITPQKSPQHASEQNLEIEINKQRVKQAVKKNQSLINEIMMVGQTPSSNHSKSVNNKKRSNYVKNYLHTNDSLDRAISHNNHKNTSDKDLLLYQDNSEQGVQVSLPEMNTDFLNKLEYPPIITDISQIIPTAHNVMSNTHLFSHQTNPVPSDQPQTALGQNAEQ